MKGARARRGVSTVVGAILAVPVLVALMLAALYAGSTLTAETARYAERVGESLALVPVVNSTGVYVEVFNSGSVSTRVLYIVARNLTDGSLIIVPVNASLAPGDSVTVKLAGGLEGRIAAYAVTQRGGVYPWSPVLPGLNDGILDLPGDVSTPAPGAVDAGEAEKAWVLEGLGACFLETWNYTIASIDRVVYNYTPGGFEVRVYYQPRAVFNVTYELGGREGWLVTTALSGERWVGGWRISWLVSAYGLNTTLYLYVEYYAETSGQAWFIPAGCGAPVEVNVTILRGSGGGGPLGCNYATPGAAGAAIAAAAAAAEPIACTFYDRDAYLWGLNASTGAWMWVEVTASDAPSLVAELNGTLYWIAWWGLEAPLAPSPAQVRGGG